MINKKPVFLITIFFVSLALPGCATTLKSEKAFDKVSIGMSREECSK